MDRRITTATTALLLSLVVTAACSGGQELAAGRSSTVAPAATAPATPPTTFAPAPAPAPAPAAAPTVDPAPNPPAPAGTPAAAARAWVAALAEGDVDTAWDLTHVASRDAFGGRAAFDESASALAEGYGAWASSQDVTYAEVPLPAAGEAVTIVVVRGTVPMEGPEAPIADAVPVRTDADGRHQVDPFQDLDGDAGIELGTPTTEVVAPGHGFDVFLIGGRDVHLLVDDEALVTSTEGADGDRQRASGAPALEMEAGHHALTVVLERDGVVQATSFTYLVKR